MACTGRELLVYDFVFICNLVVLPTQLGTGAPESH